MKRSARVLAVFRHPTPYRDPLLDRVAGLPGLELEVLYLHEGFPQTPWAREPLSHAHRFPRRFFTMERGGHEIAIHPGALMRLISLRPDAVLLPAWSDPTVLMMGLACRLLGIPYILAAESFQESGRVGLWRPAAEWIRSFMVRGASAWLPTGSRCAAWLVHLGAEPSRCHFFPTSPDARRWATETDRIRRENPRLREDLGFRADGVIVFLGRLVTDKAPEILLAAFALLKERRIPCRLVLIGDGPERAALEASPGAEHADFHGFLQPPEVARILAAADLFVLPSRYETWGAAACEAMAAGLPVVLSDSVGCGPEMAGDGEAGSIVPTADVKALADAMESLLRRPDRRTRLFALARARSIEWGHDLNLRSVTRALRDVGLELDSRVLALAESPIDPAAPALGLPS